MGIGSGGDIKYSGEGVAVEILKKSNNHPFTVFDVGGNQGQFISLVSSIIPLEIDEIKIHSFEPSKHTFDILFQNFSENDAVVLNHFGLGDKDEQKDLYYPFLGTGYASLTQRETGHLGLVFNEHEQVDIKILDDYCDNNSIGKIDLLKIDVEGHELNVLNGARKMFNRSRIGMVMFEFGGAHVDARAYFKDFYNFFAQYNMSIYRVTPSGYLYPITKYTDSCEQFVDSNYLAISSVN